MVSRRLNDGDHTARRRLAGVALGAAAGRAEGINAELGIARIHSWQRLELGWPESTGMELAVVAGVRASSESALQGTA